MLIRRERSSERVQPLASSSLALAQPRVRPLSLAACIRRLVRWPTRIGYRFRRRIGGNRSDGSHRGWAAPYTVWGAPYVPYVWGGPYVPYRSYGDWGALWYPYAEWREPHGGWGNP